MLACSVQLDIQLVGETGNPTRKCREWVDRQPIDAVVP